MRKAIALTTLMMSIMFLLKTYGSVSDLRLAGTSVTMTNSVIGCKSVRIDGRLRADGVTNDKTAILSVRFRNSMGKERVVSGWSYLRKRGSWKYLPFNHQDGTFTEVVPVPASSVSLEVELRSSDKGTPISFEDVRVLPRRYFIVSLLDFVFRHVILVALAGVAGLTVLLWIVYKKRWWREVLPAIGLCLSFILLACALFIFSCLLVVSGNFNMECPILWLWIGMLLFLYGLWVVLSRRGDSFWGRHPVVLTSLLVFFFHFVAIKISSGLFGQCMYSDFLVPQRCLESGTIQVGHAPMYAYWCNYELLLSVLGTIFVPDLRCGQFLNVLCCISILYPMFELGSHVTGRRMSAFVTMVIGLSPMTICYSSILSGELLGMAFFTWAFYFIEKAWREGWEKGWTFGVPMGVFGGVCMGMAQLMRPFALLFLGSLLVVALLFSIRRGTVRLGCWMLLGMIVFCSAFFMSNKLLQSAFVEVAKPQVINVDGGNLQRTLVKGLDVDGLGKWSKGTSVMLLKMDNANVSSYLKDYVKRAWQQFPALFIAKFRYMYGYGSPGSCHHWYQRTLKRALPDWCFKWGEGYYVLIRLFSLLGLIGFGLSWRQHSACQRSVGLFTIILACGFTVLMSLVEVQGRYWLTVCPFYFLMITYIKLPFAEDGIVRRLWRVVRDRLRAKTGPKERNDEECAVNCTVPAMEEG